MPIIIQSNIGAILSGGALSMSYSPVTTATEGVAYTGATPSTSGGTAPYTYSIHAGALPTGFSLDTSTGVISGTDSGTETQTGIVLRVTDNVGATVDSSSFSITVSADSADYTAFMARANALVTVDAGHISKYRALINGLNSDFGGALATKLDALYVFKTQASPSNGLALLNLVQNAYDVTQHGCSFTADSGFTGVAASTTDYLDTGFNPTTAASPKFLQDSASYGVVIVGSDQGGTVLQVMGEGASSSFNHIFPRYGSGDNHAYFRINSSTASGQSAATVSTALGHYTATRSSSSQNYGYIDGTDQSVTTDASAAPENANFYILSNDDPVLGHSNNGFGGTVSAAYIGGYLTPTEVGYLVSRLASW